MHSTCPFTTDSPPASCVYVGVQYSLAAVVPLHTQWFAAICCLQQLELQQDRLVQVAADKRLVVVHRDTDHWGVHHWVSGEPDARREIEIQNGRLKQGKALTKAG